MMELPNYSSQLMQQLWALRKEDHLCDCTILVGGSPHRAHKLLLAASSMLFRTLLDGSDTISIDTAVVSSQEFGCLLDMVYTGKLPLGKHNVSRIVAAADSLQMFDVAVGFKKVLANLVRGQPAGSAPSTPTPAPPPLPLSHKPQTSRPEASDSTCKESSTSEGETEGGAEPKQEDDQRNHGDEEAPACKRACVERCQSSGPEEAEEEEEAAEASSESPPGLLHHSSLLIELLSTMPSALELLSQAASSELDEQDRPLVLLCCEEADSASALEKLLRCVEEGRLAEGAVLKMLHSLRLKAPAGFPAALLPLLRQKGEEPAAQSAAEQQSSSGGEEKLEGGGEEETSKEETEEEEQDEDAEATSPPSSSSSSKPFSCRWCQKGFAYKCRMLAHVKRCSLSQECEQQCPLCPLKLANQRALQRHKADAHRGAARSKKKVACDLCGRTFAHPSGMIYHKRTEHFDEKPFACEECGAKFGANSSLKNHMRLHTGEKPYCCKHCHMSFSVAAALAYHTKKKHSEGKMYVCQYCKAVFAQSIELTRHVRTHTGDRPYVCRECGKGYSQASGLTVHLHTFHNLSEPHDCQKCCLSFSSLEEHWQHMEEFHPKEFHKCPTCSKVFTSASLLDKHKSTHSGTKPFSCDICNKSYQQMSGLWYHNRTTHPDVFASHTRQLKTLLQCDVCFKFFPSAASIAKHRAAEHEGMAASVACCPYCPAVLGGDEELQEHISTQHPSQSSCCPVCSLACCSQLELQEHLLACHMEQQEAEQQQEVEQQQEAEQQQEDSSSHTQQMAAAAAEEKEEEEEEEEEGPALAVSQQGLTFVALVGGKDGSAAAEVVEVNMCDLLNTSVTFICEEKPSHS